jgi:hypothetical protein
VLIFDNHLPIRIRKWRDLTPEQDAALKADPLIGQADYPAWEGVEELWLGYDDSRGFGGRYLRAYRNAKGEYLVWYHLDTAYDKGHSYSSFICRARPDGTKDIMEHFPPQERDRYGDVISGWRDDERGPIQVWLEALGLSKVEEF